MLKLLKLLDVQVEALDDAVLADTATRSPGNAVQMGSPLRLNKKTPGADGPTTADHSLQLDST